MREIPLTRGKVALVDDEDYEALSAFKWHAKREKDGRLYVQRAGPRGHCPLSMHRVILGAPDGMLVDHRDGDGLNNTRANLRLATPSQNAQNRKRNRTSSSGYKGVTFHRACGKWQASVTLNGRYIYLGLFGDPESAHNAYRDATAHLFGEFARTG